MGKGEKFFLPQAFHIHYDGIDAEHEELVRIVNGLFNAQQSGGHNNQPDSLEPFIRLLGVHFENEERHMAALDYPGLEWHRDHHAECLARAQDLALECERRGGIDDEIIDRCFEEVVHEVARADLKFGEFVEGRDDSGDE
jgi:hemerythrin-like metal-binding protein